MCSVSTINQKTINKVPLAEKGFKHQTLLHFPNEKLIPYIGANVHVAPTLEHYLILLSAISFLVILSTCYIFVLIYYSKLTFLFSNKACCCCCVVE